MCIYFYRLLKTFVKKEKLKCKELFVTYFVGGSIKNSDSQLVRQFLKFKHMIEYFASSTVLFCDLCQSYSYEIVPEEQLEKARERYNNITSCHVYSVSKAKLSDHSVLYHADFDVNKENKVDPNRYAAKPRSVSYCIVNQRRNNSGSVALSVSRCLRKMQTRTVTTLHHPNRSAQHNFPAIAQLYRFEIKSFKFPVWIPISI